MKTLWSDEEFDEAVKTFNFSNKISGGPLSFLLEKILEIQFFRNNDEKEIAKSLGYNKNERVFYIIDEETGEVEFYNPQKHTSQNIQPFKLGTINYTQEIITKCFTAGLFIGMSLCFIVLIIYITQIVVRITKSTNLWLKKYASN
jgi:hypothetical protein